MGAEITPPKSHPGVKGSVADPTPKEAERGPSLSRRLTLFDVVCIGVNATVGSGVFALPDDVYREMGGFSPLAFAVCAVLLLPVSLCMAELAARTDVTGGPYVYARRAFGEEAGFLVGWFCWIATLVSWAAVTMLFVEIIGLTGTTAKIAGAVMILVLGAINYVGVKPGAALVNVVTVGKLVAIFAFVGVGLFRMNTERLGGTTPDLKQIGTGVYLTLFPLQGFEVAPVTAGETKNPRRNVPLGTIGSLLFSALLYVVVQAVLVAAYPGIGAKTDTPLHDAAKFLGPSIGLFVLLGSMVSTGGFTAGSALGSPRYAEAMAHDGILPKGLSAVHPRFRTPHVAIAVTAALSAAIALPFDYRTLVGVANVTVVFQYVFSCLAVPVLRRKEPLDASKWRVPFGLLLPIAGAIGSLSLLLFVKQGEWIFSGSTLAIGTVIYLGVRSARRRKARAEALAQEARDRQG